MKNNLLKKIKEKNSPKKLVTMTMTEYLDGLRDHPEYYSSAAERLNEALGKPVLVDTSKDERLRRIFGNRTLKTYEAFNDLYGIEESVEATGAFFINASQGFEEKNQIFYLFGPPGSAKSTTAEKLKALMSKIPVYTIACKMDGALVMSPIQESPLGFFSFEDAKDLGISKRYLKHPPSAWALKRLAENDGDISCFTVMKIYLSEDKQLGICKVEPQDPNNMDISTLVGKVNIRELENFPQDDPDAYSYSGGLCKGNRGIMEFVEMFKAPPPVLLPLLTATQEGNYKGTEAISASPFDGVIIAHSNETEWEKFKTNSANEALLDRVCLVKVPYCLRINEEIKIYKKFIEDSSISDAVCAPNTLETLAKFCIFSRLEDPGSSNSKQHFSSMERKMRVLNGEYLKATDPHALTVEEYKSKASLKEGFFGISTRHAAKILPLVFNKDEKEIAANPIHLLEVLDRKIKEEAFEIPRDKYDDLLTFLHDVLKPKVHEKIKKDIQNACLEAYKPLGQQKFDKYFMHVDAWLQGEDYRDPETGLVMDTNLLDLELSKIEKKINIANPKDFRREIRDANMRHQIASGGQNIDWTENAKIREVIETNILDEADQLLPLISFSAHRTEADKRETKEFVKRMTKLGYTERQVELVTKWAQQTDKSQ